MQAPVYHHPGGRDHHDEEGKAVGNPLEITDVQPEHIRQVGHHDHVAGAARRRAGRKTGQAGIAGAGRAAGRPAAPPFLAEFAEKK